MILPQRKRSGIERVLGGKIVTAAPDAPTQYGLTTASMAPTLKDGYASVFGVSEHWNGEFTALFVSRSAPNVQARDTVAVAIAIHLRFGETGPDVACGIAIHYGNGSCALALDFRDGIKALGMTPSLARVRLPNTDGAAEEIFRTMKEQTSTGA